MLLRRSAIALTRRGTASPIISRSLTTSVVRREYPQSLQTDARPLTSMLRQEIKSPATHLQAHPILR